MHYLSRVPATPLDEYIDDIYCLTGTPRHGRLNVPPMPSAHLFINLGAPARLWDSDAAVRSEMIADGWFMGVWTRRFVVEYGATVRLVGAHFKPWGLSPFIDMPASDLRDRWVPFDAVWPGSVDRIRSQFADTVTGPEMLAALEEELRTRLADAPDDGIALVQDSTRRLEAAHGALPVGALTDAAAVSSTHLAAQFKSHVGVTPKRMARIYRFARSILSLDARSPIDLSEIAVAAGYFDQAHFSRDFKDFTGHTPTEYLTLRRRFPADRGFPPDLGPMPVV